MTTVALDLLGGFQLRTNGGVVGLPTQKYRALLAFLATPAGRAHSRDGLVALLWPELPHEQGRAALRQALWALRRVLDRAGITPLVLDGDSVALEASAVTVDVADFIRAAGGSDADSLARAAALYRGPLLQGLSAREEPFEEWLASERERLAEMAITVLGRLLAIERGSGRLDDAVQTALRLLALDPLQEAVHRALMQMYGQLGRRSAALRQYQSCVAVLQREVRADPEAATRALYQEILRRRSSDAPSVAPFAPVPAWPTAATGEAPMIGREHELEALREALHATADKRGRVAVLAGEAGMGKSRLIGEFLADAVRSGARVVVGRAHESDRVLPLAPWADAFRRARLADERDLLATLPQAWRAAIARFVPEVGPPDPVVSHGAHDYVPLFDGAVGVVTALAARSPLVIVLEDLHWADDMTLRLASYVARQIEALPVLLVLTGRPEEMEPASSLDRILEGVGPDVPVLSLALAPLAPDETFRLVRALAGRRGETAIERLGRRIWAASEGHPFMVVEMARVVSDEGEPEPATLALPQRVRGLVAHRLRQLTATAQQVVATAAAIGRDFPYALLERASGVPEEGAVAAVEEMVRRRVVHIVGDRFEFTHDCLREVAYASLLPPRRRQLHRRIAEALETLGGDDLAEHRAVLGRHYAEAEVWERAAQHYYEAAQRARERSAYREGGALLDLALDALARLPRTRDTSLLEIDVRLRLFRCLNPLGDPRAGEQVARARTLLAEHPDDSREAVVLIEVAELQRLARDLSGAIDAGERALALATNTRQPRLVAQAHFQLGVADLTRGACEHGIAHLRSTVAHLADAPLRDRLGYPYVAALARLTWTLADQGDLQESRRYADEATRAAEQSGDVLATAEASTAVAVLHLAEHRHADAIPLLARALAIARSHHIAYMHSFSASWLSLAHARCGHAREAASLLDECESERVWERVRLQWSRILVRLADARLLIDEPDRARVLAREALALARATGEPAGVAEALALLADIALKTAPDGAEAARHVTESIAIAARVGLRPLVARLQSLAVHRAT